MNFNRILLGKLKSDAGTSADGENMWLGKHRWDCGWDWAFGYVGNKNCHFHFKSLLYITDGSGSIKYTASDLFAETKISDREWWIMRDLFAQAYALQRAAEVYEYGGHQTTVPGVTDIIANKERADQLNADLAKVLDLVWDHACKAVNKPAAVEA